MFEEIIRKVNAAQSILVYTHVNMDGDAAGSAKALCLAFKKMGKKCAILCDEQKPDFISFLYDDSFVSEPPFEADLSFAVDFSEEKRIPGREAFFYAAKDSVCIDHHVSEGSLAKTSVIDSKASAAAMLVYEFLIEAGIEIDRDMAEALYTAILTDTGAFKYSNTNSETHRVVSELYKYGIDHVKICTAVYETKPQAQLRIESLAMERAEMLEGGKAAVTYITQEDLARFGARYDYCESAIDYLRTMKDVEAVAIIKQFAEGVFKVSFRGKNYANVRIAAEALGGGGHDRAAGCTLNMSLEEAYESVKREIVKTL
ncbi:MAG: bifunctional oligoribonuclease/PAP phosphatase NrnA [Firmicutes bacterium]|nr:bifunctional oligoribonuclease/PAP phosphatase NrnA [Bacillota bacterium]